MDKIFIARFPEIAEQIFQQLNNEDLIKSKVVDKAWSDHINQRLLWKRMIQSSTKHVEDYKFEFNLVLKKMPAENLKKFALACRDLANASMLDSESPCLLPMEQCAPLHVVAGYGDLLLFKHILKKSHDKDPKGIEDQITPFDCAAYYNKLEICKFYVEHAKDKEPNTYWSSPLFCAAEEGHLDVFKLIFHHAQDKNPRNTIGFTVLHDAAIEGHLEICKIIVSEVDDKNPLGNRGRTPLHFAAMQGHSEIYKFIAERVEEKNPPDNRGKTPLHDAINCGHLLHISKILMDILENENPTLAEPEAKRLRKE